MARLGYARPFTANVDQHHEMAIAKRFAGECRRGKATRMGGYAQFLFEFPYKRRFGRFSRFDLAAGKLPQSGERTAGWPFLKKDATIRIDKSDGDDMQEGSGQGFFGHRHNNLLTHNALHPGLATARGGIIVRGKVRDFFRSALAASERGATAVEYGLICAMIVLAMFVALQNVASKTMSMWNNVATEVSAH